MTAVAAQKSTLSLARGEPVNIPLTCSDQCWRRVGKLVAFEIENRGWTLTETMERAKHPVTEQKMSYATLIRLIEGEYARGGPFIATLQRVFLNAFGDSGYQIILTNRGSRLQRA